MPNDCAIQPLDVSTFPTPDDVSNPGFTDLFNELVGDAGTAADGFDADIETANQLLDAIDGVLSELGGADGGTLDDTFAEILTVDPQEIAGLQAQHAAALPAGDQAEQDLGNLIAVAAAPTGPAGGAPGPAAQPACGSLDFGSGPTFGPTGTLVRQKTIDLKNNLPTPFTITALTWSPDLGFTFGVFPSVVGSTVQPGQSIAINVQFTSGSFGTFKSRLTVHTTAPDPQPCLDVTATAVQGTSGGLLPPSPIRIITG